MPFIGNRPALSYIGFAKQDFTTSATTTYTLDYPVANENEIELFINNVRQEPTTAYTASGTTLTLTAATTVSDDMYAVFQGKAVQTITPPASSITNSMVASGAAIAYSKLNLSGSIVNADVNSSAAIAYSKLNLASSITSTDLASSVITGLTAETSIAGGDSILIYDDSATALRKMTRTNFVAGIGGTNTPSFLAYRTSAQSLTTNTDTKVQWNVEDFDTNSCYDNATNYRFTPTSAGKYVITHCLTVNNSSGVNVDALFVEIWKNGSSSYPSIYRQGLNSVTTANDFNEISFCVTKIFDMNGSTDYVEAYVHAAGTNLQTDASSNEVGFFSGYKLL